MEGGIRHLTVGHHLLVFGLCLRRDRLIAVARNTPIAASGVVAERTEKNGNLTTLNRFVLFGTEPQVFETHGYDYLDLRSRRSLEPKTPNSFGGLSGTGLWKFLIAKISEREIKPFDFQIAGAAFLLTTGYRRRYSHDSVSQPGLYLQAVASEGSHLDSSGDRMADDAPRQTLLELAANRFSHDIFPAEEKLFKAAEKGEQADCGEGQEANGVVRSDRLTWLCTDSNAVSRVTYRGVSLYGAEIQGEMRPRARFL
ncbi:MAG TPA: hypothetical protein VE860_00020 [Chthoniobacterales bacterium]|nr:hypothetical protein [Chthoniobacterales bacterium]